MDLRLERVRGNLYVLRGGGRTVRAGNVDLPRAGTTAVLVVPEGVVLVDTKLPGCGLAIREKLKEITDQPVTTIINTHSHIDHVGGNVEFPEATEVVAHETTAERMREMRPVTGGPEQPNVFQQNGGRGLPTRTFRDRMTLGRGDDRIELRFFGRGHTGGDAWVVFPSLRAVHTGDAFAHKAIPPLDTNNGASGLEYPETIARAVAALGDADTVITGHYHATLAMSDLKTYGDFTRDLVDSVRSARTAGRTIDDFVRDWKMPERYVREGYVDFSHLRPIRSDVEVIWNEVS